MQTLISQLKATSILEWIAFLFALIQVVLAIYNHILNFVAGIISVIFYIYLFAIGGLFAEASLNFYYLIISIVGLAMWYKNLEKNKNLISNANNKDWWIVIFITIFSFLISYFILKKYTSSTVPAWDSAVAAFAWSGSWLLAKHKLQNWIVLNISNAIAIPLQYQKGFVLTSLLTTLLFILAIYGWWSWKNKCKTKM